MSFFRKRKYGFGVVLVFCISALQSFAAPKEKSNTHDSLIFRIGWKPADSSVRLDTKPNYKKKYHVLSEQGDTLFIGKIVERREGTCGGDPDHSVWDLDSEISTLPDPDQSPYFIVVGSDSLVHFKAVSTEPIILKEVQVKSYFSLLPLPIKTRAEWKKGEFRYLLKSAGNASNGIKRVILFASSSTSSNHDVVISIAEVNHGELNELHTFYPRFLQYLDGQYLQVDGQLAIKVGDTSRDGLADVYLLNIAMEGDRDPKEYLLIEQGSKWTLQKNDFGLPC